MKFTLTKDVILPVLANIQGLTGRKSNLAITSHVLVRASDNSVTLTATDLETGFEGTYPAQVDSDGVIAIHARKFFEIIRDYPESEILIDEIENHWIEIGTDNVQFHIVGLNPDEFPDVPQLDDVPYFDIDSGHFKKMIDRTTGIVGASDDKRAHIIGNYLERVETDDHFLVRMVATDSGRLAKMDYIIGKSKSPAIDQGILIPKKGLNEVAKFLSPEGIVQLGIRENKFIVKKDNETFIIRLLEGDFPDYRDVMVKEAPNDIVLDRKSFLMMLKRMSILSSENYKAVMFKFDKDTLNINSTNPDIGESKEDMQIAYDRPSMELAFNPRYFIESLNVIDDERIIFNIKDDKHPCFIEGEADKSYLALIMPMRV